MNSEKKKVIIVGGGLAGLACAGRLVELGAEPSIYEAADGLGGRVRTDVVDGFRLDRGFQVFLNAYPEAGRVLDLKALDLREFLPGAIIFRKGKRHRLMDVFRHPADLLGTVFQPIGSLKDKFGVGILRTKALFSFASSTKGLTTEHYLKQVGFSDSMIDGFFRPFYGGIFLERDLRTSADMFDFTFRMFAKGAATLPAAGMEAIPQQLAARIPRESISLNSPVSMVTPTNITLENGESVSADHVVVATDADTAANWLPLIAKQARGWRSVIGLYFSAPVSPLKEPIIALNADPDGLVNNLCVLTDVAREYGPAGRALISVSILGEPDLSDLEERVRAELKDWFGDAVEKWTLLRTDSIRRALPEQPPQEHSPPFEIHEGITVCGDHCTTASIEGAITSGRRAAESLMS